MGNKREIVCGIYQIKNVINGLFYIGSSNNVYYRWKVHRRQLKNNTHGNYYLQNDWNLYGETAFTFTIIEKCDEEQQFIREQYYIDNTKCWIRGIGYNILKEVNRPPMLYGEECGKSKYSEEKIKEVIKLLQEPDIKLIEISKMTGVEYGIVSAIYNKTTWKYLTKDIDFPLRGKRLTDIVIVSEIIPRILNGESDDTIARDYDVGPKTISSIRLHESHKKLTKNIQFKSHISCGEDVHLSKFKKEDVLKIIELYNNGATPTELMKQYSVGKHAILDILHKNTWSSVTHDLYIKPVEAKIKLTEEDVKTIISKLKHGETMQSLADEYHVGHSAIQKIKYGVTWKHINRDEIL